MDKLIIENGKAVGVKGSILEPAKTNIGEETSRKVIDVFEVRGRAVVLATGVIKLHVIAQAYLQRSGACSQLSKA